jgi:phage anti-repressor protein
MDKLITVSSRTFGGKPTPAVNARDLYSFLSKSLSTRFNDWITRRIEEYGFEKGRDYLTQQTKTNGRPRAEYFVTLDMAKELAMVERNEKGRQARRYFIDCEKQLKKRPALPKPEEPLPSELQRLLDEKIGFYTGQAHIAIKRSLTASARSAVARGTPDPVYLFDMWSDKAETTLLLKQDVHSIAAVSKFLSGELLKFHDRVG